MKSNSRAGRVPGVPFHKGDDPRRGKNGALCAERAAFATKFANALATQGKPEELAKVLWDAARSKRPWAIEMILDRLMGKPNQPMTGEFNGKQSLTIKVVQVKDGNGNGNSSI